MPSVVDAQSGTYMDDDSQTTPRKLRAFEQGQNLPKAFPSWPYKHVGAQHMAVFTLKIPSDLLKVTSQTLGSKARRIPTHGSNPEL